MRTKSSKEDKAVSLTDEIFSQILNQHNEILPGSAMSGEDLDSEVTTWIDSGSLLLNLILSNNPNGGWPCGRIVHVFGKESIGKSTLAYCAIASCQKRGGFSIYVDLEHAANKSFMKLMGIDLNKIIWSDIDTIEDLFTALEQNLTILANSKKYNDKPNIVVIDSNAALMSKQEVELGYDMNMNTSLLKSKQMHKALRKINRILNKSNTCLFVIDQIKDNVTGYGASWTISGAKALAFYSSVRLYLEGKEKIKAKDPIIENQYQQELANWKESGGKKSGVEKPEHPKIDEVVVGCQVTAFTHKNKVAPPERTAHFRIMFAEGLKDEECYFDYLLKFGAIKKRSGAYYEIVEWENDAGAFYRTQWLDVLSDKEIYDKTIDYIVKKMSIQIKDNSNYVLEPIVNVEDISEESKGMLQKIDEETN